MVKQGWDTFLDFLIPERKLISLFAGVGRERGDVGQARRVSVTVSATSGVALERGDVGRVALERGGATRVSATSGVALERGDASRIALERGDVGQARRASVTARRASVTARRQAAQRHVGHVTLRPCRHGPVVVVQISSSEQTKGNLLCVHSEGCARGLEVGTWELLLCR